MILALLAITAIASPDGCASVLRKPACEVALVELAAIERLLCVELQSSVVTATAALEVTVLDETCATHATALSVHLAAGASFEPQNIALPLADVERELRPRTAALLILENVRAFKEATKRNSPPEPARLADPKEAATSIAATPTVATKSVTAIATPTSTATIARTIYLEANARHVARANHTYYGARAGLAIPLFTHAELDLDAGFELGNKTQALGTVRSGSLSLSAAVTYAVIDTESFDLHLGPRLELGYAWATGDPANETINASSTRNIVAAAGVKAGATIALNKSISLYAASEVARPFSGIDARVANIPAAGITGWLARFSLGARYTF